MVLGPATAVVNSPSELVGKRVTRGPDWKWGSQDHGGQGTIFGPGDSPGWFQVVWDSGDKNSYRMGADNAWDLSLVNATIGPGCRTATPRPSCQQMVGKRVRRGPDWKWGQQDDNKSGKVLAVDDTDGWLSVSPQYSSSAPC
jgi:hypothetical protein